MRLPLSQPHVGRLAPQRASTSQSLVQARALGGSIILARALLIVSFFPPRVMGSEGREHKLQTACRRTKEAGRRQNC